MGERGGFSARAVLGLVVLAVGVVFLLDNLGVIYREDYLHWWPAIILAFGLVKLLGGRGTADRTAGVIWMLVGGALLLHQVGSLDFDIWELWPLVLILLGANLLLKSIFGPRAAVTASSSSKVNAFAFLSGTGRKIDSQEFAGGDATAIMGGCEIDLRGAAVTQSPAVLDVFAMWGGVDIFVPGDWTVTNHVSAFLGGIEDNRKERSSDGKKQLVVKGLAIMGGIEIRN